MKLTTYLDEGEWILYGNDLRARRAATSNTHKFNWVPTTTTATITINKRKIKTIRCLSHSILSHLSPSFLFVFVNVSVEAYTNKTKKLRASTSEGFHSITSIRNTNFLLFTFLPSYIVLIDIHNFILFILYAIRIPLMRHTIYSASDNR